MSEEIKELKETLERSLQNPSLIDREKTERFYKGIINLQQKVDQLENIRKEAIEYIGTDITARALEQLYTNYELGESLLFVKTAEDLLNILNKGE